MIPSRKAIKYCIGYLLYFFFLIIPRLCRARGDFCHKAGQVTKLFEMRNTNESPAVAGREITYLRCLNSLIMFDLPQTEIMLESQILCEYPGIQIPHSNRLLRFALKTVIA